MTRGRRLALALVAAAALAGAFAVGRATGGGDDKPNADSVDVGFLRDMADHHDQAVRLALIELDNGQAEVIKGFALDTIVTQRYEIGLMEARLRDWGHGRGQLPRPAMAWMVMSSQVDAMPGMATADDLAQLGAARGLDADRGFVRLMTAHHEGGLHMAEYARKHAATEQVRDLADRIAKLQAIELRDLERARQALTPQPG